MDTNTLRLGVNIDHVATLRNARGEDFPDVVRAARAALEGGAQGITAHLREDRRHIRDADMERLAGEIEAPLNFEMAAAEDMVALAERLRPHAACLVPERREELTTEGGLNAARLHNSLSPVVARLRDAGARVSLFIDPDADQLEAAVRLGAPVVELHTGPYCEARRAGEADKAARELQRLVAAADTGAQLGLEVHAGHGLCYATAGPVAAIPTLAELNIGHFLISEAVFLGLEEAVRRMRTLMDAARSAPAMPAREAAVQAGATGGAAS
ncbi:MAG: pyridoxine 5'-phosphate synthase [Alphaproteobacteria bacterium]